ncbi:MAG TPA: HPr(Ser) kinase/phosphatase [Acidiferrobacteraceae bacterium]|nr:HPr(Ser) kinase/phosphatase [Acidiferrobacteraceae bacterium]HEX19645.1 HPr(Ser) kinase/phosphatase [Acidiferrobacteraceae bacterium]
MSIPQLTADDLFAYQQEALKLEWVAGKEGKDRLLENVNAVYPGIALVGYLNIIHPNPIQIIGPHEIKYLEQLPKEQYIKTIEGILQNPATAMVLISDGLRVPEALVQLSEKHQVPLLGSHSTGPQVVDYLQHYLAQMLAPRVTLHGVYMEVLGIGVFVSGKSGIGKSELALELLSRNHRLIADDAVEFMRVAPDVLVGQCPEMLSNYLEVRGLGVLNVRSMFGETAIRNRKKLHLVVNLKAFPEKGASNIDRFQAELATHRILELDVPEVVLYVASGRNLAVLVEVATRSYILRMSGNNPADDFIKQQQEAILNNNQ